MKQQGCHGIHSEVAGLGLKGRYAESKNEKKSRRIEKTRFKKSEMHGDLPSNLI
jgi:hypothetical protein